MAAAGAAPQPDKQARSIEDIINSVVSEMTGEDNTVQTHTDYDDLLNNIIGEMSGTSAK